MPNAFQRCGPIILVALAAAGLPAAAQSLQGKRIVLSAGHGYYWHSTLGWITQRPTIDGLTEDFHTNEIIMDYVTPLLEGAGATVIHCRARTRTTFEAIGNNDQPAPAYLEQGSWSTSGSAGYLGGTYRFTNTASAGGATAIYTLPVATTDILPVYVWYRAGANRTTAARFEIDHAAGTSIRYVDQTVDGDRWVWVGDFPYRSGETATLRWSNQSTAGGVLIADAVKLGDGMGSIVRGGTTSGQPRWRECSRYHAEYFGAPSSVWNPLSSGQDNGDDVTCRPFYGEWWGADLFMSLHTNAGGGSGTSTWIHDTQPTAGSAAFQSILHNRIVTDIRAAWNAAWIDDGQHTANFGEVRELSTMPGVLVELAYHDDLGGDIEALHHPRFRKIAGRALYRGIVEYLAPGSAFSLEPPTRLLMRNDGLGKLILSWSSVPTATSYRVRLSNDGFAYDDGQIVAGASLAISGLGHGALKFATVAAINSGGVGFASEPVGARLAPGSTAPLLLVNGFDRHDRSVKEADNRHDGLIVDGHAVAAVAAAGYPFDGANNEAVSGGLVNLAAYRSVGWVLGEESSVDQTFDSLEQLAVGGYIQSGGRFFYSGAEVGWDLDWLGSASDRSFYENVLGQDYVADDAGVYATQALATGPLAPLPAMTFGNGSNGAYNVDYPDVVAPAAGTFGSVVLRYTNGQAAAVLKGGGRVLGIGFPIEALVNPADRSLVMQRLLALLCPLPLSAGPLAQGSTTTVNVAFPQSPNEVYVVAASGSSDPGTLLVDGRFVPINLDALFVFASGPQPYFTQTVGTLDGFGNGQALISLPVAPGLSGFTFVMSAVTVTTAGLVHEIAPWISLTIP